MTESSRVIFLLSSSPTVIIIVFTFDCFVETKSHKARLTIVSGANKTVWGIRVDYHFMI
jgi:hypothetical protein